MAKEKDQWRLQDLIDFEIALEESSEVSASAGDEIREGLSQQDFGKDEGAKRRWGLLRWLRLRPEREAGQRVVGVTRFLGIVLLGLMFLGGIGLIRGLIMEVRGTSLRGFNIWILLAATIGVQGLFLLGGVIGYFLMPKITGGLDWVRELIGVLVKKCSGTLDEKIWRKLTDLRSGQKSAVAWRLGRVIQLGGIGWNLGLLTGLFGVLWFTETIFFWESSFSRFGPTSLKNVVTVLSLGISGINPSGVVDASWLANERPTTGSPSAIWKAFFFFAIFLWGLLPRLFFYLLTIFKERKTLKNLHFQDPAHRKLWRGITRVERTVVIEGPSDGVVLLDVGGLNLETEKLRPFLLQTLRVNPEKTYSVGILDEEKEAEAWSAIKKAPCGLVLLVEGWSLSPKQMISLINRIREAADDAAIRVLVLGDGVEPPEDKDFAQWQKFIDELRDPNLECIAYEEGVIS